MYSLGLDGLIRDATPDRLFARTMTLNQAGLMTLQGIGFALAGAVADQTGACDRGRDRRRRAASLAVAVLAARPGRNVRRRP